MSFVVFFISGIKDDKVKVITINSMTGAVVYNTAELVGTDNSPTSDSVDGSMPTDLLNTDFRKSENIQVALNNLQGVGKHVLLPGQTSAVMISTHNSLLTAPHVQTVSNEAVSGSFNVLTQSSHQLVENNNKNDGENTLKRPISASATTPVINKVIITNDPSTSQPQVVPVGQVGETPVSLSRLPLGVNLIPQSQSPRTPTKTITISQQGILSPSKGIRMTPVANSPPRLPISRLPGSPAKTPTKITMIPVSVGRSPLKIAPATTTIPVINNSATNSSGPLHNTITMSPSKMIKQGGTVHIVSTATLVISFREWAHFEGSPLNDRLVFCFVLLAHLLWSICVSCFILHHIWVCQHLVCEHC